MDAEKASHSAMLGSLSLQKGGAMPELDLKEDRIQSKRLFRTVSLYLAYLCKGMVIAILGASLLDLETQTNCSSQEAALLLTWSSLGRLPGSLLAAILFDRFTAELQLMTAMLLMGTVVFILPWLGNYAVLSALIFLQGVCIGYMGGGCNSYCFALWRERSAPIIQGLHFTLSVGCSLAPLVASPFLISTHKPGNTCRNSTANVTCLGLLADEFQVSAADPELESAMVYEELIKSETVSAVDLTQEEYTLDNDVTTDGITLPSNLLYPCLIVVVALLASMAVAFSIFIKDRCVITRSNHAHVRSNSDFTIQHVIYISLFAVFFFCLGGLEVTYGGLLVTFTVRALNWDKTSGMYVTTLYWTCIACGRGIGILLTRLLKSEVIITIDVIMACVSITTLALAYDLHPMVTWICSAVFGLSIATGIVNGLVICSKTMHMSSKLASFLMGSVFSGMMVVPAVTGFLIKRTSPVSLIYTLLAVSFLFMATLFAILAYRKLVMKQFTERYTAVSILNREDSRTSTISNDSCVTTTSSGSSDSSDSSKSDTTFLSYTSEDAPFINNASSNRCRTEHISQTSDYSPKLC